MNKGTTDLSTYNIFRGSQLPEQVTIGVVPQESYNGSLNTNPFNFKHYDIREASLIVNWVNEPVKLYKLDVNKGYKADMFASFLDNTSSVLVYFLGSILGMTLGSILGSSLA